MGRPRRAGELSYRLEFDLVAAGQIPGMPDWAFRVLVAALVQVKADPYQSMPLRSEEPDDRQVVFGERGLVTFYINKPARLIVVYDVTWTG
ncbi:hypothetical protein [Rhizohabitans arisaemae]|uniref:hypothetical protein n=1 Tax=Rhizohabitans arisaemae TaxID=2720610 RepID=UPI0024B15E14|nr:hypothetical protein [Rhizohabitans arisaemae]